MSSYGSVQQRPVGGPSILQDLRGTSAGLGVQADRSVDRSVQDVSERVSTMSPVHTGGEGHPPG